MPAGVYVRTPQHRAKLRAAIKAGNIGKGRDVKSRLKALGIVVRRKVSRQRLHQILMRAVQKRKA